MVDLLFRERLPDGWSYGVSNDGRVFFVDDIRQRTTWIHPIHGYPLQSGHFADEGLPVGWEMNFDLFGKPYYVDHGTHLTTYSHPRLQDLPVYSSPEPRVTAPFSDKRASTRKSFSRRKSLSDPPAAKRDPVAPIIKQGWLFKQESGFIKSWKRRWAVLTNRSLFLYKTADDVEQNEICSVVLPGYCINPCSKSDKALQKFAFKVEHKDTKPVYLAAETEEDMWEWMETLTKEAVVPGFTDAAESNKYEADRLRTKENLYVDDARIPNHSSLQDKHLTNYARGYQPRATDVSDHQNNNHNLFQPHEQPGTSSHFANGAPQRSNFNAGRHPIQEPSATSTPIINMNHPGFYDVPQRSSFAIVSGDGLLNNLRDGRHDRSVDYRDVFGHQPSSSHGLSQNPRQRETEGKSNGSGGHYSYPLSHSVDGSVEFSLSGRHDPLRAWEEPTQRAQDRASKHTPGLRYSHEQLGSDRSFASAGRLTEPTFERNQYSQPHRFKPLTHSSVDGDYFPMQPPVPAALRSLYIDDLAATKTPHSRNDLLQAKELSQRRLNEPNVFQFPESPPKQTHNQYNYSDDPQNQTSHYAEVSRYRSRPKSNPATDVSMNTAFRREPAFSSHPQNVMSDPVRQENRISISSAELLQPNSSHLALYDITADPWKGKQMTSNPNSSNVYASVSPRKNPKIAVASHAIEPIKEDPSMLDTDVLNTRTLQEMQKHMLGHTRLRLSISVQDLVGKSQEELVLLLIQLRRSQTKLEKMLLWSRNLLSSARPQEKAYKLERKNSFGRIEDALEHEHEYFVQLQKQTDEIEKQINVTQPLINLLDNIVTMGSLYNGDRLMYASQYKKGQLHPDQIVPTKKMLEFSRMNQEARLASKQEQSERQLTEDEVDLEEKLQQLYALDTELQDHSNAVTSLQEDKVMLERMLDKLKKEERTEVDHNALQSLVQQRQICEKNLLSVRQNLADASKCLEETNAENARIEQQVVMLRNRIHGGLVKSQSFPSLLSSSGREAIKMEEDLKSMQATIEDLASQGTKISEAMENLKKSSRPGAKAASAVSSSTTAGYMETDLDTKVSRDISIGRGMNTGMGSYRPATDLHRDDKYDSAHSSRSVSSLPNDRARIEYKYVAPPTVHQIRHPTSNQYGSRADDHGHWENFQLMAHDGVIFNSNDAGDRRNQHSNQFGPNGSARLENNIHRPGDYQLDDDVRYSVFHRSKSLPRLHEKHFGFQEFGRQSMNEGAHRKPSIHVPVLPSPRVDSSSSANHHILPSRGHASQIADHYSTSHREELKRSRSSGMLSNIKATAKRSSSELQSIDLQHEKNNPSTRSLMGTTVKESHFTPPSFSRDKSSRPVFATYNPATVQNAYREAIDKANTRMPETEALVFDGSTIDKALFHLPEPVEIPERYMPDSSDEDESFSLVERAQRKEKADQIKKAIAKQSLQDFSQDELTIRTGPVQHQINDETQRRERILDVKRSLAQEVVLKSKEDAALRRKDWSNTRMAYMQNGHSNAE